jgi:hypothetical protein
LEKAGTKNVTKWINDDTFVFTMYLSMPDSAETKAMEITYTRDKSDKKPKNEEQQFLATDIDSAGLKSPGKRVSLSTTASQDANPLRPAMSTRLTTRFGSVKKTGRRWRLRVVKASF